jgi:hypothetical protein
MTHTFTVDLSGLTVLKDREELFDKYFIDGHPHALIPGFVATYNHSEPNLPNGLTGTIDDIHNLMLGWPETALNWGEYQDQNGAEYDSEYQIADDGLITIGYTLYDTEFPQGPSTDEITFTLTGYVITHPVDDYQIFVVTSITHME